MKIAIYHDLPSGGAKRAVFETTRRLATRHEVHVFSLSSADHGFADLRPFASRYEVVDFLPLPLLPSPFGRLNQILRWADLMRLRRLSRRLVDRIEQDGFDVVLVHPCQFEGSPSALDHLERVPAVYYCHEPLRRLYEPMPIRPNDPDVSRRRQFLQRVDPLPGLYARELRRNDRRNLRSADLVLVNSEFTRASVRRIYQVEARVCYLGVDAEWFRPIPADENGGVLSVGSLTSLKGFDFLIRALGRIPAERRPRLRITSNFEIAQEREYLTALARRLGVGVDLLGAVSDQALVRLYNEASLTVYAPIQEPFGLVALESLACGTPVVAVREGGVAEIVVHGVVGLLVDRDERQFAEAVESLMESPVVRDRLGKNGRELVVRSWTWEQAAARLEASLLEGMSRHAVRVGSSSMPQSIAPVHPGAVGDG